MCVLRNGNVMSKERPKRSTPMSEMKEREFYETNTTGCCCTCLQLRAHVIAYLGVEESCRQLLCTVVIAKAQFADPIPKLEA